MVLYRTWRKWTSMSTLSFLERVGRGMVDNSVGHILQLVTFTGYLLYNSYGMTMKFWLGFLISKVNCLKSKLFLERKSQI